MFSECLVNLAALLNGDRIAGGRIGVSSLTSLSHGYSDSCIRIDVKRKKRHAGSLPTDSDKLFSDSVKIAVKELAPGSEYSVLVFERERRSRTGGDNFILTGVVVNGLHHVPSSPLLTSSPTERYNVGQAGHEPGRHRRKRGA